MTEATIVEIPQSLVLGYVEIKGMVPPRINADWSSVTNVLGLRDYFGTEAVDGASIEFGQRLSRCYELAAHGFVAWPDNGMLVHGSIHGPDEDHVRIAHAWLRVRTSSGIDLVWEPITHLVHLKEEWERAARAREEYAYDKVTAAYFLKKQDHSGPWQKMRYR